MTDEKLQFEISQYLDGTLPEQDRAAIEDRLRTDAAARKVLEEYRRINDLLNAALPVPEVDWDKMQKRISAAVSQAPTDDALAALAAEQAQSSPWRIWASAALAAGLLIAASVAFVVWKSPQPTEMIAGNNARPENALVQIAVLTPAPAAGTPVAEIQVSRAAGFMDQVHGLYPEDLTVMESRVTIAGLPVLADDETLLLQ